MSDFEALDPTLQNVLDQKSLKWIFCGMSPRPVSLAAELAQLFRAVDTRDTGLQEVAIELS